MKNVVKTGISALLVGGLMMSGSGVFNAGDGAIRTAKAASATKKKAGTVAYSNYIGTTKKHGKDAYRALYIRSRGIVNSKGSAVDSQLLIDSKSYAYVTHDVTYYKSTGNKSWTNVGTTRVSGNSAVLATKRVASTGTYYAKITTYAKDSRGKTKTYKAVTNTFYHSSSVR